MSLPYQPWGDFDAPTPYEEPKPSWGIPSPISGSGDANPSRPYNPNEGFKYGSQPVNLGPQLPDLGPKPVGPSYKAFDPSPPPQPGYVPGAINTPWAPIKPHPSLPGMFNPQPMPMGPEERPIFDELNPEYQRKIGYTPGPDDPFGRIEHTSYNDAFRGQPQMPFFKKKRPQVNPLQQWLMSHFGLRGM